MAEATGHGAGMTLDPGREPPGVPPPPILETPIDRLIDDLFGSTAPGIGARDRAYLHGEIERLREWARRRYHPFPDGQQGPADDDPAMEA